MPLLTAGGLSSTEGCEGRRRARLVCMGDWSRSQMVPPGPKAVGEGLGESCGRHRMADMPGLMHSYCAADRH